MLSDFWAPIAEVRGIIAQLSANGAHGHVVQIVDPAEESFPYSGRIEFIEPEGAGSITAGRAETWRTDYQSIVARSPRRDCAPRPTSAAGASRSIAPIVRPSELLVGAAFAHGRQRAAVLINSRQPPAQSRECRMIGSLPLGFAQPLVLLGLLSLPVLWWLLRLVPPRPRRIDFPPTRLLFEIAPKEETPSRTPWWLTLLRLTLAALVIIAAAGPLWNPPLATASRGSALADPARRRLARCGGVGCAASHGRRDDRARRSRQPRRRCVAAVGNRARYFAAARRRSARTVSADQAKAVWRQSRRCVAADRALSRSRAGCRGGLAVGRCRSRQWRCLR